MNNQTAMQQLLNQLREERDTLPMDIEWNRCFQSIESVIESKYISIEKKQIIRAFCEGYDHDGDNYDRAEIKYYTSTYGS